MRLLFVCPVMVAALTSLVSPVLAGEPAQISLAATSRIEVEARSCGRQAIKRSSVSDPSTVHALVVEFGALRTSSTGVYAAKISCATVVKFIANGELLTSIHVFPCSALELAPVRGKRYFTYQSGVSKLPTLAATVGASSEGKCSDA
jgi:hypothetical protein